MQLPTSISARNEHCCALACLVYLLAIYKTPTSQEDLIEKYRNEFPKWKDGEGMLSRGDLVNLVQLERIPFRRFFHTPNWAEAKTMIEQNGNKLLAGFIFTRKNPLNHCYFLAGVYPDNKILIMRPDRPTADIGSVDPTILSNQTDCDYLIFLA